jgi:hypothetical protein
VGVSQEILMKLTSNFKRKYVTSTSGIYSNFTVLQPILDNLDQHEYVTDYLDFRNVHNPMEVFTEQAGRITDSFNRIPGQAIDLMQRVGHGAYDAGKTVGQTVRKGYDTVQPMIDTISTGIQERMKGIPIPQNLEAPDIPFPFAKRPPTIPIPQDLEAPGKTLRVGINQHIGRDVPAYAAAGSGIGAAGKYIRQRIKNKQSTAQSL